MAKKSIKRKAFFITIEGSEGSGKSSVIAYLAKYFKKSNYRVKVFREPGSTKVGEKIRRILLDKNNSNLSVHTELLLYLAARTQLIEEKLQKALVNYDVVVCDRYFDSTLVYQGVALGLGDIAEKSVKMFSLGVIPDLTIVLDIPPCEGLRRLGEPDRIESRPMAFHNKLRDGYRMLAKKYPKRVKIIDARGELGPIYQRVEKLLSSGFKSS
jgi:dTMP kinase